MKSITRVSLWAALLYEFLGTAVVTYAFTFTQDPASPVRAFAYFLVWILAYQVSGAHLNPATSLAVFIIERECSNLPGLLLTILSQLLGAHLGILFVYLLAKDYVGYGLLPSD